MTIFTSSFAVALLLALAPVPLLLAAGCDRADSVPTQAAAGAAPRPRSRSASSAKTATSAKTASAATPAALYTADLARAVAGAKKVAPPTGVAGIGDLICSPGTLSGTSPASRALTLTLPANAAARADRGGAGTRPAGDLLPL